MDLQYRHSILCVFLISQTVLKGKCDASPFVLTYKISEYLQYVNYLASTHKKFNNKRLSKKFD